MKHELTELKKFAFKTYTNANWLEHINVFRLYAEELGLGCLLHYTSLLVVVIKEAWNPVLFPVFVELICSDTQREDLLSGAMYKRLVLPRSPMYEEASIRTPTEVHSK